MQLNSTPNDCEPVVVAADVLPMTTVNVPAVGVTTKTEGVPLVPNVPLKVANCAWQTDAVVINESVMAKLLVA
jgi:hypothetical protein